MTARSHHVAILGCGVIGLSTGLAILEAQFDGPSRSKTRVTIVAKELPGSATPAKQKHSAEYASVWAGGHHVSDAKTERELRHDKITFDRMSRLAQEKPWRREKADSSSAFGEPVLPITKPAVSSSASAVQGREPLVWVHQTELFEKREPSQSTRPPYQGVLDWYPDFKELPPASLAPRFGWGCTFSTIDINVPVYLDWLLERFLQLGGRIVVSEATSLQHAIRIATSPTESRAVCRDASAWTSVPPVDALVVSPGLGARSIDGINDLAIHPQRGQVVVVHAPWLSIDEGNRWQNPRHELPGVSVVRPQGGREVYVIPRGDGTVVCGGTRIVDEWDPSPRAETTRTILERCLKIMPQLVDPRKRNALTEPRVEDIEVLSVNVGLRPARRGGVRLEKAQKDIDGVKIIFNYGYGGAGYQASWGAALEAKKRAPDISVTAIAAHQILTGEPQQVCDGSLVALWRELMRVKVESVSKSGKASTPKRFLNAESSMQGVFEMHTSASPAPGNLDIAPTTTATMTSRPDPVTPFALNTPLFNVLAGKRVVLASSSPRRKQILASVGLEPEIVPSTFEEDLPKSEFTGDAVYEYPVQTGSKKALELYKRLVEENPEDPPDFVISADTVVIKDEVIMEKPADAQDNLRMLADLNGNKCEVVTGVTVIWPVIEAPGFQMRSLCERTVVRFADNPYYLLKAYVDSNEGIDRAGGFAIQGRGSLLVRCIEGDYNNVVGFPLYAFSAFLHDLIENDELDMVQDD